LPLFILSFLLPIYAQRLGASAADIGGLFSIFALVVILVRPIVGAAMDRFGRKGFLVGGLLCYVVAMGVFTVAGDIAALYLARSIQGLGAALTWIAAYTIAAEIAVSERRGEALGQVDGASDRGAFYGTIVALALLSWLQLRPGWQVLFLGYTGLAVMGVGLAWRYVPETWPAPPGRPAHDRVRARSVYKLLGVRQMITAASPPVFWPLVRLLGLACVTKASSALVSPLLLVFLQNQFTTDLWNLALAYIPAALVFGFLPAHTGRLSDRMGRMPLMAVGLGGAGLASCLLPGLPSLGWFMGCFALNALGLVVATPAQKALVGDLTRREDWGKAFGLYTFASSLGSAVGPLLGGWLYDAVGHATPFYANGILLLGSAVWVVFGLRQDHMSSGAMRREPGSGRAGLAHPVPTVPTADPSGGAPATASNGSARPMGQM
jgi:MFS family permease